MAPLPIEPIRQELTTCWEPGPLYCHITTGYFLDESKFFGRIITPLSSTPSEVLNLKNSFCGTHRAAVFLLSSALSFSLTSSLPLLLQMLYW